MRLGFFCSFADCARSLLFMSMTVIHLSATTPELQTLQDQVHHDLDCIYYPEDPFIPCNCEEDDQVLDVAIVGGGQCGMAAAFALMKLGVMHIKILDASLAGKEGCWLSYARMNMLRTGKYDMGPAHSVPCLTFRHWYEAQYGAESFYQLSGVPTAMWMDYLCWYRQVLDLPIENSVKVISVEPEGDRFRLLCECNGASKAFLARKVVLATGRMGFGGPVIPDWLNSIPSMLYAHSFQHIDFNALAGKRIGILGVGASAFDCAAVALEHGADSVHLLMRRATLPTHSGLAGMSHTSFRQGFYYLSDANRWRIMAKATAHGVPPPKTALWRVQDYTNIFLHANMHIVDAVSSATGLTLMTTDNPFQVDFLIVCCGFDVDGSKRPELQTFIDQILLWRERIAPEISQANPRLARSPYLGSHFEFLERCPSQAPYLRHLYCFNHAAALSHGLISSDIDGISIGAARLAEGIAADFFVQHLAKIEMEITASAAPVYDDEDIAFLQNGSCAIHH